MYHIYILNAPIFNVIHYNKIGNKLLKMIQLPYTIITFNVIRCKYRINSITKYVANIMKQRFYSLDVFRGLTVALMILVNTPGSWSYIYPPLEHAEWHGLTATDLVFPFFLFAVGNAMAFVMPKLQAQGSVVFWNKVLKRTVIIFVIGFLLNWFPFVKWSGNSLIPIPWQGTDATGNPYGIRIMGVLQRIALCYLVASIIAYYTKPKYTIYITIILLLGYWGICYWGNTQYPYSITGWVGNPLDHSILGVHHVYFREGLALKSIEEIGNNILNSTTKIDGKDVSILFDPEGILSTIAAIAQVVIGYIIGGFIIRKGNTRNTVVQLLTIGLVLGIIGTIWHQFFPVNKKIWTSSYTILTSGMATLCIAMLIYAFEIKKLPTVYGKFFDAFGKNPLFIFVLSGALPRLLTLIKVYSTDPTHVGTVSRVVNPLKWFYENVISPISTNHKLTSFVYALIMILFYWLIAYLMDKKKIYVKV